MVENEILEALARIQLSGNEVRILFVLMRKTWGWKKNCDWLARGQLIKLTGLDRQNAYRALRKLLKRKIVLMVGGRPYGSKLYGINMNFREWELSSKMTTSGKLLDSNVGKNDLSMSSILSTIPPIMSAKMTPTKEIKIKKEKNLGSGGKEKTEDLSTKSIDKLTPEEMRQCRETIPEGLAKLKAAMGWEE